jgi:hypothetical protein
MGFLDRFKKKATAVVDDRGDTIGRGMDKTAGAVDDKTGGRFSDHVDTSADKAKDALDDLDGKNDDIADTPGEQAEQTSPRP